MRTAAAIHADIVEILARLDDLRAEHHAARQAEIDTVIRLFDAGLSFRQIARQVAQTTAAVQGIVFRSGRTVEGRAAIHQQINAKAAALTPSAAAPVTAGSAPNRPAVTPSRYAHAYATHAAEIRAHAARE